MVHRLRLSRQAPWPASQYSQYVSTILWPSMLSAQRSEQFGQDYGVWLKEWRLFQRAIFVLDRADHIAYAQYVTDQLREPDYAAALQAVLQAALA